MASGRYIYQLQIADMIRAYIKPRGIKLLRIGKDFCVMVNGDNIQVNRPAFLYFVSCNVENELEPCSHTCAVNDISFLETKCRTINLEILGSFS